MFYCFLFLIYHQDKAIECFDEAIKIDPLYYQAWYNKGEVFSSFGKYDEALKCYDGALRINPDNAYVWYNRGAALFDLGK